MSYAKLIDGQPKYAPNPILIGANYIYNPPDDIYIQCGYKPLILRPCPDRPPHGYHYEERYIEEDDSIQQTWELVQNPESSDDDELDPSEIAEILLGGDPL